MVLEIKKGATKLPDLICIYGESGVGKTSFASGFKNPIFLCAENGMGEIDSPHVEIKSYTDLLNALRDDDINQFDSIVIDSLDWLESLIYQWMMEKYQVETVQKVGGGYGAYVSVALTEWQKIVRLLNGLRSKGKNIVLISHYQVKPYHDPQQVEAYDKYKLKLQDRVSALITEWVDVLLFAKFETFVKQGEGMKKNKAVSSGRRVAYPYGQAAFDAKTRFKMPESFEFSYEEYQKARGNTYEEDLETLLRECKEMGNTFSGELWEKIAKTISDNKNNYDGLLAIKARMKTLIEEKK